MNVFFLGMTACIALLINLLETFKGLSRKWSVDLKSMETGLEPAAKAPG